MPSITLTIACDPVEARAATRRLCAFLASPAVGDEMLFACELVAVEACSNAVQYAPTIRRHQPITLEAFCSSTTVELRIHDHTDGFNLPTASPQPEPDVESGRGFFLMCSMMDTVTYQRAMAPTHSGW